MSYAYGLDLIEQERAGLETTYLVDGLGSTRALLDEAGEVAAAYSYDAYGNLVGEPGAVENAYRFAGEQWDEELGQYYLRQRYYDPTTGRFTRRDTWEGDNFEPVTLNKHIYANADPVNGVDPSGLYTIAEANAAFNIANTLNNMQLNNGLQLAESILTSQMHGSPISDEYEVLVSHGGLSINDEILACLENYTSRDLAIRFLVYGGALPVPKRAVRLPVLPGTSRITNPISLLGLRFPMRLPGRIGRVFGTVNTLRALGRANAILARGLLIYDAALLTTCLLSDT